MSQYKRTLDSHWKIVWINLEMQASMSPYLILFYTAILGCIQSEGKCENAGDIKKTKSRRLYDLVPLDSETLEHRVNHYLPLICRESLRSSVVLWLSTVH